MVKPLVKWAGGKRQIVPTLMRLLPPKWETYYEPFAGGAALLCELHNTNRLKRGVISDTNDALIGLYRIVKEKPQGLIEELSRIEFTNDKKSYLKARAEFNRIRKNSQSAIKTAALFIYLNRHSFNGLWRVNKSGDHNVPFGNYDNPLLPDRDQIMEFSNLLERVQILSTDFSETVMGAREGDFVYFDPPYFPVSRTANFTTYTSTGFYEMDQEKLLSTCLQMERKGVHFMLSNSDTEKTRDMFSAFTCRTVPTNRSINSRGSLRTGFTELIITDYESA